MGGSLLGSRFWDGTHVDMPKNNCGRDYQGGDWGMGGGGNQAKILPVQGMDICRSSNFTKDHRAITEVPDPLVVGDLISYKLNDIRKLARLIYFPIYWMAWPSFLRVLQRNTLKKEGHAFQNIGKYIPLLCKLSALLALLV